MLAIEAHRFYEDTQEMETDFTTGCIRGQIYSFNLRKRREFAITETELKLMAAAARIGLSNSPKNGYRTPAAMGTPSEL